MNPCEASCVPFFYQHLDAGFSIISRTTCLYDVFNVYIIYVIYLYFYVCMLHAYLYDMCVYLCVYICRCAFSTWWTNFLNGWLCNQLSVDALVLSSFFWWFLRVFINEYVLFSGMFLRLQNHPNRFHQRFHRRFGLRKRVWRDFGLWGKHHWNAEVCTVAGHQQILDMEAPLPKHFTKHFKGRVWIYVGASWTRSSLGLLNGTAGSQSHCCWLCKTSFLWP